MRDFITGIAILLILVLTAALAGPYLIDWNGQRGFLEARLTQALGQTVTIGGRIDLKLLPTPYLVLDQTVIGEDDGPIRTGIRHLDLELSIAPLLHGEFDIVEARLEAPIVRVTLQRDRTLPTLPRAPALRADVRFERITMVDGTIAIADPTSGHTFVADHLDMIAEAPSLAGPFKGGGTAGSRDARTKFHFATTAAQAGKGRVKLVVEETASHPGLDIDGLVTLTEADAAVVRPTFAGTVALAGHVAADGGAAAWKLSGPFKADPMRIDLDGGELRIGGEDSALTLQAKAQGTFGATPDLHLDLTAKQLDIDRLAGAPVDGKRPAPPRPPSLARLRAMLVALTPPVPSSLDVAIDAATYGGEPLADLRAHVGAGATPPLQVSAEGPGGLHVALDGRLTDKGFDGAADIGADNLPRALVWAAAIDPEVTLKPHDLPVRMVRLAGKVAWDGRAIASDDLALTFDRSTLTGKARATLDATPRVIDAVLVAKTLDLDTLPSIGSLGGLAAGFDLDLTLDAAAVRAARVGGGGLDTGRIGLTLSRRGATTAVTRFEADDIGGARIAATGRSGPDGTTLAGTLDAKHLEAATALLRRLAPGGVADALVARAPALAPARLTIEAAYPATKETAGTPTRLALRGQLGKTAVDATMAPGPDGTAAFAATLDAPEGSALLAQLGVQALPLDTIGKSRLTIEAKGKPGRPLETALHATFGPTTLGIMGSYALKTDGGPRVTGAGSVRLDSPDLGPLAQSLAIAFPDMTGRLPASGSAGLAAGDAGIALSDIAATVGGTKATGALKWTDTGPVRITGALQLDRLALSSLLGLALGAPQAPSGDDGWSTLGFAAGLIDPPRSDIALTIKTLDLGDGLAAGATTLDLAIEPNRVGLRHLHATLAGGRLVADLALRRDGRQATMEGSVSSEAIAVDLPSLTTRLTGNLNIAGGGTSLATLVGSLAGTGDAKAEALSIVGADPKALPKVFDDVETDALAVDEESVARAFDETARGPDLLGDRAFSLALAGGALRWRETAPTPATRPVTSVADATLDLRRLGLAVRVEQTLHALPKNWSGPLPVVVATQTGPIRAPKRGFDVSGFVNAVATRALARETARIEAYEFDIKERNLFNQRLLSERRREQDRVKAEDDARRAEAEQKARAEAARLEKLRREEAAKAKAAADKAAQERATQERALQEKALRDKIEQDKATAPPTTAPQRDSATPADPSPASPY